MLQIIALIISLLSIAAIVVLVALMRRNIRVDASQEHGLELLTKELKDIRSELHGTFEKNLGFLEKHSSKSNEMIRDITSHLEQVLATNKQVVGFAGQLQSLENILRNPKHRGIVGEYFLEQMLSRVLPQGSYKMQHSFKNGEIVDAAILFNDGVVPIDAKFSLEKYNRIVNEQSSEARAELEKEFKADLKRRVDETSKYIRTEEGTVPYAIMYVPAEGVLHGLSSINYEDLVNYAHGKRVLIASPNSLLAYLQVVMQSLKFLRIQESTQDIIRRVDDFGRHMLKYEEYMKKLGGHLGTTVSMYNQAYKEFEKIDKDVARLTNGNRQVESVELDKPSVE